MDRELTRTEKNKNFIRSLYKILLPLAVLAAAIFTAVKWIDKPVPVSALSIAEVDRGSIGFTVNASGRVMPLDEEIIVSPINTRILEVYKSPGDSVLAGEPLLRLDLSTVETEYLKKIEKREVMRSKLIQVEVRLRNAISELKMQKQIHQMKLRQLETDLRNETRLDSIGASTGDKVRQARLAYDEAVLALELLEQKLENENRNSDAELRVQQLELSIFEKTLDESAKILQESRVYSPKTATLTYINNVIGTQVSQGTEIAVISDLSRFRIECEVADNHRDKLSFGSSALFKSGNRYFPGSITNIVPLVTNGQVSFTIIPDEESHKELRSGMRTEVDILYDTRTDVLRLPNGPWYNYGPGTYTLWVVVGNVAERRIIEAGESSFDHVEIISGLHQGERVILSDMERYSGKTTIKLKDQ